MTPLHADGGSDTVDAAWLADINTTPLVDVMLVLLIVFMVTMPVLTQSLQVDLPRASAAPANHPPTQLTLTIREDGTSLLDGATITVPALQEQLQRAGERSPDTELNIAADRTVAFERITDVMALARQAGLTRIGFITRPKQ